MHSTVQWIRHTGKILPKRTRRLEELPRMVTALDTHGQDAVVSLLEKKGMQYLVIVNAGIKDTMKLSITFQPGVIRIRKDGTKIDAAKYVSTYHMAPGDCEVFSWKKE